MGMQGEYECDATNFQLTDSMKDSYDELGYFLIRGFLSNEELTKLKTAVENERFMSYGYGLADGENRESRLVMWRHPGNDVTGTFGRCQKVVGTCEKLLGGEVYHYHTKLMTKAARTGGKHIWHQDYGYWYKTGCLFPGMMTSAFIPIDRCVKESGCLEILIGSHMSGRIEHTMKAGQTGADLERVEELKKVCPHSYVEMEAGDALFFSIPTFSTLAVTTSATPSDGSSSPPTTYLQEGQQPCVRTLPPSVHAPGKGARLCYFDV